MLLFIKLLLLALASQNGYGHGFTIRIVSRLFGQTNGLMQAFDPNNPNAADQFVPQASTLQQVRLQEQALVQHQNLEVMQKWECSFLRHLKKLQRRPIMKI